MLDYLKILVLELLIKWALGNHIFFYFKKCYFKKLEFYLEKKNFFFSQMESDPLNSMMDPYDKVWEIDNLYVADSSVFPSTFDVNLMISIFKIKISFFFFKKKKKLIFFFLLL